MGRTDEFKARMITNEIVKEQKENALWITYCYSANRVFNTEMTLYLKGWNFQSSSFLSALTTYFTVTPQVPKSFAAQSLRVAQSSWAMLASQLLHPTEDFLPRPHHLFPVPEIRLIDQNWGHGRGREPSKGSAWHGLSMWSGCVSR